MAYLKEEWQNLMKNRGIKENSSGIENIRAKIFNHFVSPGKKSLELIEEYPSKTFFDKSMPIFHRTHTPEPQQKFEFGLKLLKTEKSPPKEVRSNKSVDIWKLEDYPFKEKSDLPIKDKFEVFSIADKIQGTQLTKQDLCIFSDMSPVSRQISNLTIDEEKFFLKQNKKYEHPNHNFLHLLRKPPKLEMLERTTWKIAKNLSFGHLFKVDLLYLIDPDLLQDLEEQEKPMVRENDKSFKAKKQESLENLEEDFSELEKEMIEMLESLNQKTPGSGSDEKINVLLEIVAEKMRGNKEAAGNMQLRVLYQFLLEYKKAKESKNSSVNQSLRSKKSSPSKSFKPVTAKGRGKKPQFK
jgi:hypothetical protein